MRIGTANTYDNALQQLYKRQGELASQQEQLSSGLRVNRASDDPLAMPLIAQAHQRLQQLAVLITDEPLRQSFLQDVPMHREINAAFDQG
mgnify:CR=1 FL=1